MPDYREDAWARPEFPAMLEYITEAQRAARRTSERSGNQLPTITEMLRWSAENRKEIDDHGEAKFYLHLENAKFCCIARDQPPDGWGLRGDAYEQFSSALGYKGKAGRTLPRLYDPYGERVVEHFQTEAAKARAKNEVYDWPSWRQAYDTMVKEWEPKPTPRRKNSQTPDETLDDEDDEDPAEALARAKAEIAGVLARSEAANGIVEQRFKEERMKREEAEEDLAKANTRIAQLEAELDRIRSVPRVMPVSQTPTAADSQAYRTGEALSDKPVADDYEPSDEDEDTADEIDDRWTHIDAVIGDAWNRRHKIFEDVSGLEAKLLACESYQKRQDIYERIIILCPYPEGRPAYRGARDDDEIAWFDANVVMIWRNDKLEFPPTIPPDKVETPAPKRGRGRPKGSKNPPKSSEDD